MGDLKKLGKYTIQSVLGQGAMGIVYQGFDPVIERTVAIKAVRKDAFKKEAMEPVLARFKREAQAAGRLTHPGIVTVYDYGEDGDNAFIAMEYVPGRELDDYLDKKERFSLETVIDIISQLLDALIYSHSQGVVHRDIKPENIIVLDDGRIKVMDFGIAKIESSTLTQFGDVFGTPSYMSPEQFAGQPVDNRSDLYSTGVILYHLLTGEKPFHGDSITSIMHRVMTTDAPLPSDINVQVPSYLDEVVRKALAKKPGQRFQTAEEFKNALTDASAAVGPALQDLYGKTNPELREMCTAAGITGVSRLNKKQLITALQDAETGASGVPEAPASSTTNDTQHDAPAVNAPGKKKEYAKTLFEPLAEEEEEEKPKRSGKKLRRVMTFLLLIVVAISGFTAWKVYKRELTYRELQQIIKKAEDDPAALFGQLLKITAEKSKEISVSAFDKLSTVVKKKAKEVASSVSDREAPVIEEKPEAIPATTIIPVPKQPAVEESPAEMTAEGIDQEKPVTEVKPEETAPKVVDPAKPVVEAKPEGIAPKAVVRKEPVRIEKPNAAPAESVAKDTLKDVPAPTSPVREITPAGKKSKSTPPPLATQEPTIIEITQTAKHKVN